MSTTFTLYSQPYLDTCNQCYKNIVTVNMIPRGPFSKWIQSIQFKPLSEFKTPGPCTKLQKCGYAVLSLHSGQTLMTTDEVPELLSFLMSQGYTIDTSITKMLNTSDIVFDTDIGKKLICFVTYNKI